MVHELEGPVELYVEISLADHSAFDPDCIYFREYRKGNRGPLAGHRCAIFIDGMFWYEPGRCEKNTKIKVQKISDCYPEEQ